MKRYLVDIGKENVDGDLRVKAWYLEYIKRNGKVITFPVSDRKHDTLIPLIKLHTKKGSLYYTDWNHTAYASLDLIGKHQIIANRMEEYVREDTSHINGIEGFWSYAKTWLYHYPRTTQTVISHVP